MPDWVKGTYTETEKGVVLAVSAGPREPPPTMHPLALHIACGAHFQSCLLPYPSLVHYPSPPLGLTVTGTLPMMTMSWRTGLA